jgi:hypothetical protein
LIVLDNNDTAEDLVLQSQLFELYSEFTEANQNKVEQLLNIDDENMKVLQFEQNQLIETYAKNRSCYNPLNTTALHLELSHRHASFVRRGQINRQKLTHWQMEQKNHMWNRVLDMWNVTNNTSIHHHHQQQLLAVGWHQLSRAMLGFTLFAGNYLPPLFSL